MQCRGPNTVIIPPIYYISLAFPTGNLIDNDSDLDPWTASPCNALFVSLRTSPPLSAVRSAARPCRGITPRLAQLFPAAHYPQKRSQVPVPHGQSPSPRLPSPAAPRVNCS